MFCLLLKIQKCLQMLILLRDILSFCQPCPLLPSTLQLQIPWTLISTLSNKSLVLVEGTLPGCVVFYHYPRCTKTNITSQTPCALLPWEMTCSNYPTSIIIPHWYSYPAFYENLWPMLFQKYRDSTGGTSIRCWTGVPNIISSDEAIWWSYLALVPILTKILNP